MNQSIERSIKDRVKKIAADQNREFGAVWLEIVLERWLARIHKSNYKEHFIFKGGMCLREYLSIGRETQDLDFLLKGLPATRDALAKTFEEISQIDLADGFSFTAITINHLAHPHMKYPGFAITMRAELSQTRTPLRIDIGVGDIVKPENLTIHLSENKGAPLFEKEIDLWAYSPEAIFAEKFETAVKRDSLNSRMKDYHDLYLLAVAGILDQEKTRETILATFKHRSTKLSSTLEFPANAIEKMNTLWVNHLKKLKGSKL